MKILGFIIALVVLMIFITHHKQYKELYPNGVEAKMIEAGENCSRILVRFAVPESAPSGKKGSSRKPENPSWFMSQKYNTTLTWEQIRTHYLEIGQKDGWILDLDKDNYMSFKRGSPHDRYLVSISLDGSQCTINVRWDGLSN